MQKSAVSYALTIVLLAAQSGCASGGKPGAVAEGPVDPTTGVVRPADGSVPFYPGDISLRSVPSMPRVPKRDANKAMALWTEELIGRPGAHLFARNDGPVPLRIAKVSVYQCINIEGGCVDYDPNLVLQPGEKQRLYTVVPLSKSKTYRYQWRAWGGPERTEGTVGIMPRMTATTSTASTPGGRASTAPPASSAGTPSSARTPLPRPTSGGADGGTAFTSDAKGNPLDTQGATLRLTAYTSGTRSVTSTIPATIFRSRRMRLYGDVDARNVSGDGVTLFIKVDGASGVFTAESGSATRITGTKKATLSVNMTIPADAKTLTLGATLNGAGDVTVTQFKFREVTTTPRK